MRTRRLASAVGFALALAAPAAPAQEPAPYLTGGPAALPPPPPVVVEPLPAGPAPAPGPAGGGQPLLGMDLMLGMQTGIRPQIGVWHTPDWGLMAEGFYGAMFTKFASTEAAGAGLRMVFRRNPRAGCDTVLLGPGVDMLCQFRDGGLWLLAPTIDVAWRHPIGESSGWEIGLNAGIGIGVSGQERRDDPVSGRVTPLISLYSGLRF